MLAVGKPRLVKPITFMEVTHYTTKVVFQRKMFICGNDTLFSSIYKTG